MRLRKTEALFWIFVAVLVGIVFLVASLTTTLGRSPATPDTNDNNMVESTEAIQVAQDYFAGEATREEAVDAFLHYFSGAPLAEPTEPAVPTVTPIATPAETGTPSPEPTPLPTPTPTPTVAPPVHGMLDCRSREHGLFYAGLPVRAPLSPHQDYYEVVDQRLQSVEVGYVIPDSEDWEYGFVIRERTMVNYRAWLQITHEGEWILSRLWGALPTLTVEIVDTGYLDDHDVPWNTGAGERNELVFLPRIWEPNNNRGARLYVNGVQLPAKWSLAGLSGSVNTDRYDRHRSYALHGTRGGEEGPTDANGWPLLRYENLCTVNAWE